MIPTPVSGAEPESASAPRRRRAGCGPAWWTLDAGAVEITPGASAATRDAVAPAARALAGGGRSGLEGVNGGAAPSSRHHAVSGPGGGQGRAAPSASSAIGSGADSGRSGTETRVLSPVD